MVPNYGVVREGGGEGVFRKGNGGFLRGFGEAAAAGEGVTTA